MPWCEECAKYYTPNSVETDGSCPRCGRVIQLPEHAEVGGGDAGGDAAHVADDEKAPWHFKLMVVMVAVYLGWRFVDLLM